MKVQEASFCTSTKNKTQRIVELDIARVIGMYLVVFGHLYSVSACL